MVRERLYIVHGRGPDSVGLIGQITSALAGEDGNIVDLRQDVLHGLFILYMVVDLAESALRIHAFTALIARLSEDTGLTLTVEKYNPIARNPEKQNMLIVLAGTDRSGIIASIAELLGTYSVNIEFANNISREGVFLMELLTDISQCSLPIDNVKNTVSSAMAQKGIRTLFQTEDVFNKKRRVILFDLAANFLDTTQRSELAKQLVCSVDDLIPAAIDETITHIAQELEGCPRALYDLILSDLTVTSETVELMQSLKTMGYTVGLITSASTLFTEKLATILGIKYAFGIPYPVDEDTQNFTGARDSTFSGINRSMITADIIRREHIDREDITVIDRGNASAAGIHPIINMATVLDLFNKRSLSRSQLVAILFSFGVGAV